MTDDCATPGLLPIKSALELMLAEISALKDIESVEILQAYKRVLGEDVSAAINVPPADNSAMDGYALRAEDLTTSNSLKIVGKALAGEPYGANLNEGDCVRIMTGAVIPQGANAVVMQEQTHVSGDNIVFTVKPKNGANIRRAGEDIASGSKVLNKGTKLRAVHLSLLASLGIAQLKVVRHLKVALIATGDELTTAGEALKPGGIYESNRFALHAMLSELGFEVIDMGIVKDDKKALRAAFAEADKLADLVISSGGVSVGDADYVRLILAELGQINFWKVAIKPGKPFAFGKLKSAWFCGLPGNPVSSYVTFQQLVMPLLSKLSGENLQLPQTLQAINENAIRKQPGRADFQRGSYYLDEGGQLRVSVQGKQGSGIISSIANANCYILLEQQDSDLPAGSRVKIQPFDFIK
jgi:molybdopterin molybdotransferase